MYQSFIELINVDIVGLYGFSMALNIDCLPNLGTLFAVKHLWSISSSLLCKVGPRLFSGFTSTVLSTSLVPPSMVVLPNRLLEYFSCMLYRDCYSSDGPWMYCSLPTLDICFWMSHTCVSALGDDCVSLSILCVIQTMDNFQEFSFKRVLMPVQSKCH